MDIYPKIMICGHAQHGKDTLADALRDIGYKVKGSSVAAAEIFLRKALEENHGLKYASLQHCYDDRVNHRSLWYDLICEYNQDEPDRLMKMIYRNNDIYVGIRNDDEFWAGRRNKRFDVAVWVDASSRGIPPEGADSNKVTPDMCDVIVSNNSYEGAIKERIIAISMKLQTIAQQKKHLQVI